MRVEVLILSQRASALAGEALKQQLDAWYGETWLIEVGFSSNWGGMEFCYQGAEGWINLC